MAATRWIVAVALAIAPCCCFGLAQSDKARKPSADNSLHLASVDAQSVSFTARHSHTAVQPGSVPPILEMHVVAKRPAMLLINSVRQTPKPVRTGANTFSYDFHGGDNEILAADGVKTVEYNRLMNTVRYLKSAKTIEDVGFPAEDAKGNKPAFIDSKLDSDGLIQYSQTTFIFGKHLSDFHRDGTTTISGRPAIVYKASYKVEESTAIFVIYVDPKTNLPMRVSMFGKGPGGKPEESDRTDYSDWKLNPKISDEGFHFKPPANAKLDPQSEVKP